jgi:hypothetical protein
MNKLILTGIILLSTLGIMAQVGIGTADPQATLDVVADNSNPDKADAILVPRMSVTELAAKDDAFLVAQNGSLVFVTAGSGTAGKTSNINGVGFYYYDASSLIWVAVGGGGTAPANSIINVVAGDDPTYAGENIIVFSGAVGSFVFPDPADYTNRTINFVNAGTGTATFATNVPNRSTCPVNRGTVFFSNGTGWFNAGGF